MYTANMHVQRAYATRLCARRLAKNSDSRTGEDPEKNLQNASISVRKTEETKESPRTKLAGRE
jgi:hypothetical protein